MSSLIKSISVTIEEHNFLKEYNLSPSQLIKEKIGEMKGFIRSIAQEKIEKLARNLEEQCRLREKAEETISELRTRLKNVLEKQKSIDKRGV